MFRKYQILKPSSECREGFPCMKEKRHYRFMAKRKNAFTIDTICYQMRPCENHNSLVVDYGIDNLLI